MKKKSEHKEWWEKSNCCGAPVRIVVDESIEGDVQEMGFYECSNCDNPCVTISE